MWPAAHIPASNLGNINRARSDVLDTPSTTSNGATGAGSFALHHGEWKLYGINSHDVDVNNNGLNGDPGDRGRNTRTDAYPPWIDSVVPTPGAAGVFGVLGALGMMRPRR